MVTALILTGVITALTIAFMMYASRAHYIVKLSALLGFLLIGMFAFNVYVEQLGAPIPSRPEGEHGYVWHVITPESKIIIWTTSEKGNRIYIYDYDRDEAAKLEEQRLGVMDGRPGQIMIFGERSDGDQLAPITVPNQNLLKP